MTISYQDQSISPLVAGSNTAYTAGTINSGKIDQASLYNTSSSNVLVTGTVNGSQLVSRIVPSGNSIVLHEILNVTLKATYTITFTPAVADVINLSLSIKEVTT